MAFGQYAHLDIHLPVALTAQEIENNLPPEDKADYKAAQVQEVSLDKPILLFRKAANDNEQEAPKPETAPDQAETAMQKFDAQLNSRLQKLVTANKSPKQKRTKPNRTPLKTAHAPKPAAATTKAVSSEPLQKMVEFYQKLNETKAAPLQHRGSLRLLHTVEAVIAELPKLEQDNRPLVHGIFFTAKLVLAA